MQRFLTSLFQSKSSSLFWPLTLIRVAFGLFFFTAGFNKLFVPENRAMMLETITEAGIFLPDLMAPFVSLSEAIFGLILAFGLLSRPSALVLLIINVVALMTVGIYQIPSGLSFLGWYSWLLYLPESPYILFSLLIMVQGSGPWAIDQKIMQRLAMK